MIGALNPRLKSDGIRASRTRPGPRRVAEGTRRLAGFLAPSPPSRCCQSSGEATRSSCGSAWWASRLWILPAWNRWRTMSLDSGSLDRETSRCAGNCCWSSTRNSVVRCSSGSYKVHFSQTNKMRPVVLLQARRFFCQDYSIALETHRLGDASWRDAR